MNQKRIEKVLLPLPQFMRVSDMERLCSAFKSRGKVYGLFNPDFTNNPKESNADYIGRFRQIRPENVTHYFTDFRVTDRGMVANLTLLDPTLFHLEADDIVIRRRCNNYYWKLDEDFREAPGFFGFDLIATREPALA